MNKLETLQRLLKEKEWLEKRTDVMTKEAKQRELNSVESAIYYLQEEIKEEKEYEKRILGRF